MERGVPGGKSQNRKEHKNILFWKKLQKKDQYGRNVVEKRFKRQVLRLAQTTFSKALV